MTIKRAGTILILLLCTAAIVLCVRDYLSKQQKAQEREELFDRLQLNEAQESYLVQYTMPKPGRGWRTNLLSMHRIDSDSLNRLFPDYTFLRLYAPYNDGLHPLIRFLGRVPVIGAFTPSFSLPGGYFVNIIALDDFAERIYTFRFYQLLRCCYSLERFPSFFYDARILLQTESDVLEIWEAFVNVLHPDKVFSPDEVEISHPEESVWIIRDLGSCECEYRVDLTEEKTIANFRFNKSKD